MIPQQILKKLEFTDGQQKALAVANSSPRHHIKLQEKGRLNQSQRDTAFTATRVNIVVPEVYDPKTDSCMALENARMAFPLYPQLEVVQTGPGMDD